AGLLAWRYPTLRHREVVAAVGVWALVWLGILAVGPGSMGHPLVAGGGGPAGGGRPPGGGVWGGAGRGGALPCGGGGGGGGGAGGAAYLLASSRYFGDFYERVDAARWFVIHLVFFEETRTASWILGGAIFGLVSCLAAMALMLWVRVMLPPPHAFARRG